MMVPAAVPGTLTATSSPVTDYADDLLSAFADAAGRLEDQIELVAGQNRQLVSDG